MNFCLVILCRNGGYSDGVEYRVGEVVEEGEV